MYSVFASETEGLTRVARFKRLHDALAFVDRERAERSLAIRMPNGYWYRDELGRSIFGPRRQQQVFFHRA